MYQTCSAQDPTWPIERYVDPANPTAGLLSLKPNHPERILFAAIAGVPLTIPTVGTGAGATTDWDRLLGAPSARGADDFCGRDTSMLGALTSAEGPISMQQANADTACPMRVVPACRREGSPYSPTACTSDLQYFAWPSRRIIEVARRFDQDPVCNGAACGNGLVTSICSNNYGSAMQQIVTKIQSRLVVPCLPRVLQTTTDASNHVTVQCVVRETLPVEIDACDPTHALNDPMVNGVRAPMHQMVAGVNRRVCEIDQVATDSSSHEALPGTGWFYDVTPNPASPQCTQRISFTSDAVPVNGSTTSLECIQSVTGVSDGGP